ncbi:MAG: acyl carrier protein [Clostridiales bacterium]|jgi:acyl carrier protein|nr:acyl carrier protein [Clostridiales bacterium]
MFETVKGLLVTELSVNADDITEEAELVGDLGINSLELADLVLICEEKFGIEIADDDVTNFVTVGDVVEYLENATDAASELDDTDAVADEEDLNDDDDDDDDDDYDD